MTALSTLTGHIDAAASVSRNNGVTTAKELNDRFLRLLIAQMNNQDPLNPLDNAQVTSQMAQINTVTGINGLNETVAKLIEQFARLESLQAAQLTGRSVLVQGNALALPDDGNAIGGIELALAADRVTVEIRDAAGQVVRELQLGRRDAGVSRFDWDGKTARAYFTPGENLQGWAGYLHGGIAACVLDEAMGWAAILAGTHNVTAKMQVRYRRMAPIGQTYRVECTITKKTSRLIETTAILTDTEGRIFAEGTSTQFIMGSREGKS